MAWNGSGVFGAYLRDIMAGASLVTFGSDAVYACLFNNTVTPDKEAAAASTGYDRGTWVAAAAVGASSGWPSNGGHVLNAKAYGFSAGVAWIDAEDPTSDTGQTIANAYGVLLCPENNDPGLCFIDFGGATGVTAGTYTVRWSESGIVNITY